MDADVARGIAEALRTVVPDVTFAVEACDSEARGRFGHEPHYRARYEVPPETVIAGVAQVVERLTRCR